MEVVMRCGPVAFGALLLSVLVARVVGQTTRPAESASGDAAVTVSVSAGSKWDTTIKLMARGLLESDAGLLEETVGEFPKVNTFDGRGGDAIRLLARTCRGKLILARGYDRSPATLAADLAEAARGAAVPIEVQRRFAVRDEQQLRQANAVAEAWIAAVLSAKPNEPVGVIAFWTNPAKGAASITPTANSSGGANHSMSMEPELVFVLIKGQRGHDGATKVSSIVFGDATTSR
jgi:hypothetical protein